MRGTCLGVHSILLMLSGSVRELGLGRQFVIVLRLFASKAILNFLLLVTPAFVLSTTCSIEIAPPFKTKRESEKKSLLPLLPIHDPSQMKISS